MCSLYGMMKKVWNESMNGRTKTTMTGKTELEPFIDLQRGMTILETNVIEMRAHIQHTQSLEEKIKQLESKVTLLEKEKEGGNPKKSKRRRSRGKSKNKENQINTNTTHKNTIIKITTHVKERDPVKNTKYRRSVIRRDSKCIISGVAAGRCQVAHIKPHCVCDTDEERYDPDNGLYMDAGLHMHFDKYNFSIHPKTFEIMVNPNIQDAQLMQYNGVKLKLDGNVSHYLEYHHKKYKARKSRNKRK